MALVVCSCHRFARKRIFKMTRGIPGFHPEHSKCFLKTQTNGSHKSDDNLLTPVIKGTRPTPFDPWCWCCGWHIKISYLWVLTNLLIPHFAQRVLPKVLRRHMVYTFWSLVPVLWVAQLQK